jgi:hypothetical protein
MASSYAVSVGRDFLMLDPLSVPDDLRERATAVTLASPCSLLATELFTATGRVHLPL